MVAQSLRAGRCCACGHIGCNCRCSGRDCLLDRFSNQFQSERDDVSGGYQLDGPLLGPIHPGLQVRSVPRRPCRFVYATVPVPVEDDLPVCHERKRRERGRREARSVQASCAFSQAARVCDNALQRRELDFSGRTRCAVEGVACLVIGSSQNRRSLQEENPPISPGVLYQFCQAHQSCTRTVLRGEPARIRLPFANFSTRSRRREKT